RRSSRTAPTAAAAATRTHTKTMVMMAQAGMSTSETLEGFIRTARPRPTALKRAVKTGMFPLPQVDNSKRRRTTSPHRRGYDLARSASAATHGTDRPSRSLVGMGDVPGRWSAMRQRARTGLLIALAIMAGSAVLGLLGGLVWNVVAPRARLLEISAGTA